MKQLRNLFFLLLVFSLLSCTLRSAINSDKDFFKVKSIVDGDTFWIDDGSEKGIKVRLIGVDAPESRNAFKKVIGYYGKESKQFLTDLMAAKKVRLEFDIDSTDQFGRTLAYVYLSDGIFVNAELVKHGYAMVMTVPPNVRYAEKFLQLEQKARKRNKGLWTLKTF